MKSFVAYILNYKDKLEGPQKEVFVKSLALLCKNIFEDIQEKAAKLYTQTKTTKTITTTVTQGLKQLIDVSNLIQEQLKDIIHFQETPIDQLMNN